jgi:hypothetical protein
MAQHVARLMKRGGGLVLGVGALLFLFGVRSAIGIAFAGLCIAMAGFALGDVVRGGGSGGDAGSDGGGDSDGGGESGGE